MRDVHLARGGVCRYHLYVQIRKRQEGEAKNIMLGAFAGHYDVKHVIVVDEDVDIHNPAEVEWAVATRFQADRDLVVIAREPGLEARSVDPRRRRRQDGPRCDQAAFGADEMVFKRIRVPGEEKVDVGALLAGTGNANWRDALKR